MEEKVEKKGIKNKLVCVLSKLSIKFKIIFLILIAIGIGLIIFVARNKKENSLSINATSSLQRIIEINELSTVDYTYNAIATKYEDNKKENEEYYVAYEGVVTAGIDFNKIKIDINEKEKKVNITLPEVEIHEVRVNMGTMEYIYVKNIKEEESISQEAYKLCKQDLKERLENEENLYNNARENAISAVEALFEPWIKTVDKQYKVEVK